MTTTAPEQSPQPRGTEPRRTASRARGKKLLTELLPLIVLVALVLVVSAYQPSFLSFRGQRTLFEGAAPIILLAIGQMFVILTGGIDLSLAVQASLGSVLLALWLPSLGAGGVALVLLCTFLTGALNGLLTAWAQIPSFIVTLGTMGLWGGVALWSSGASAISISDGYEAIGWVTDLRVAGLPVSVLLAVAAAVLTAAAMRYLSRGRLLHAMGLAEQATMMSGTRTPVVRVLAFGLAGLFAGFTAVLLSSTQFAGGPTLANSLLLPVIAAVVVGGTAITGGVGGPLRTLVGALVIAVLRVGMGVVGVDPAFEQIIYGLMILAAVSLTLDRARLSVVK